MSFQIILLLYLSMLAGNPLPGPGGLNKPVNQEQKPLFSFGIIADVQFCDCDPAGSRYYRNSTGKLREALNTLSGSKPEFVINLGDLIDRDIKSFVKVTDIIDSSGLKMWHVTGNHDYSVEPRYKKRLPLPLPSGDGYYSFVHMGFRFIALNGNDMSTYASGNNKTIKEAAEYIRVLKESGSLNALDWNGGLGTRQLDWLKRELDISALANEKVILLCHFPAFPDNRHNLLNYREVLSLLKNYSHISAWLNGHNHAGNYGNFNRIHFVTFKGMVETEDTGSFALVEVYPNKIWIRGSGREKSQILAY